MSEARLLNALWHSVLPNTRLENLSRTRHNVCYGAEFDGIFYAAAIWTTPIASNRLKDGLLTLELRRLAISADAPRNTASRMICIMSQLIKKKFPSIIKLISYQSTQHHKGTIYSASGWTAAATSKFTEWHKKEGRPSPQIFSNKARWEKNIRNST